MTRRLDFRPFCTIHETEMLVERAFAFAFAFAFANGRASRASSFI